MENLAKTDFEGQTNKTHFNGICGLNFTLNTESYKLWNLNLNHN